MGVIDYLTTGWLNRTYDYLKETGGPTYPPTQPFPTAQELAAVKVGDYSEVGKGFPITYSVPTSITWPFNSKNTGIVPLQQNKADAAAEIAKAQSTPNVLSNAFGKIYSGMMNACVADQMHGHVNPCAGDACREFAETGDTSRMMFTDYQKTVLGIPIPGAPQKPDDVQQAENNSNLQFTTQLAQGVRGIKTSVSSAVDKITTKKDKEMGFPTGVNLDAVKKGIAGIFPSTPQIGNTAILMVAGGLLVFILLIRR